MTKPKKKVKMPQWLWRLSKKILNYQEKHFLSFIWYCEDRGCHCWNQRLSKRFRVCPRQIRRWIAHLRDLQLISIGHPDGRGRTIWRRPYFSMELWLKKKMSSLDITTLESPETTQSTRTRTKMSTLDNAQQKNNYKTSYSSSASPDKDSAGTAETNLSAQSPLGSRGSAAQRKLCARAADHGPMSEAEFSARRKILLEQLKAKK